MESRFGEELGRRRSEPGKSGRCRARAELAILETGGIQGTGSAGREKEGAESGCLMWEVRRPRQGRGGLTSEQLFGVSQLGIAEGLFSMSWA